MSRCVPATVLGAMLLGAAAIASPGTGHSAMDMPQGMAMHKPPASDCTDLTLACAATVSPTLAADGTLLLAARVGDRLFVARSSDGGRTFSPPVPIDTGGATLDWGPDARPQLAIAPDKTVLLAYATFRDQQFNGEVFLTRSTDGGVSFAAPTPITDVQESQRFPRIAFDHDGRLFATWLDKRGRLAAKSRGETYPGAGLAVATSPDAGGHIDPARIVRDNTCECCRIALAFTPAGDAVVLFRNIFPGGVRDHAVITFRGLDHPGPLHRVSVDDWKTDACPHHGPSLAIADDGSYHAAWYTLGTARRGLFYARSTDGGVGWSEPMQLGPSGQALSRPYVLAGGSNVWLVWKAFDGQTTRVMTMASHDVGAHWSTTREVDATDGSSDHPILVELRGQPFLSWQTGHGYRLEPLGNAS